MKICLHIILYLDIICSSKLTVFLERHVCSRKTVCFPEQNVQVQITKHISTRNGDYYLIIYLTHTQGVIVCALRLSVMKPRVSKQLLYWQNCHVTLVSRPKQKILFDYQKCKKVKI